MEFEAKVSWDKGGKVCKMTQAKSKEGKTFFIGDLGKNLKITLHKIGGDFGVDKKGNSLWNLSFVPVTYTKVEPKPEPKPAAPDDGFVDVDKQEIPF